MILSFSYLGKGSASTRAESIIFVALIIVSESNLSKSGNPLNENAPVAAEELPAAADAATEASFLILFALSIIVSASLKALSIGSGVVFVVDEFIFAIVISTFFSDLGVIKKQQLAALTLSGTRLSTNVKRTPSAVIIVLATTATQDNAAGGV